MKLVKEHINFERKFEPKKSMGIGIYQKRYFDDWNELVKFIWENIYEITGVKDIKQIISSDRKFYFKQKYYEKIENYMDEYISFRNASFNFSLIDADIYALITTDGKIEDLDHDTILGKQYWAGKNHGIRIEENTFKRDVDPTRAMRTGKYEPNPENPNDTVKILVDYNFKSKIYTMLKLLRNHYENVYIRHENNSAIRWRVVMVQDSSATIEDVSDLLYQYILNKTISIIDYDR